jgi:hypothetical protein
MEDAVIFWNVIISLVFAPIFYVLKLHHSEQQRLGILLNKTREEVAKDYVTRTSVNIEFERIFDKLDKLDAKIDKLITD